MPELAKVLKDEIRRLARREARSGTVGLKKDSLTLKHAAADLKRRLAKLESLNKRLAVQAEKTAGTTGAVTEDKVKSARITGKMIRSIRARLGLSRDSFAKLLGVSSQSIFQWERKKGRLDFRGGTKAAIIGIRKLGKREAKERLAESKRAKKKRSRKR